MEDSGAAEIISAAFLLPASPSPRQLACLLAAAEGCSERETALRLGVSASTVHSHLERVRRRLGVRNTTAAVAQAVAAGWIILKEGP